jgi:lactate dehydrogenase-like 2-hydroxyacid dehydrogenase
MGARKIPGVPSLKYLIKTFTVKVMKHSIAILDNIHLLPKEQKQLQALSVNKLHFPSELENTEQQLIERTGTAEAILISPWAKITENYLKACPSVRYIGLCGTATGNIDLKAVKKRNITLTNVKDYGDEPAAEYMFMLLLMLARGEGKYQWCNMPTELMGKTIGIIGLGALGKAIAYLALGFKMSIYYYSLHRKPEWEEKGITYATKKALLKKCEIIAISSPTKVQVMGQNEFEIMRPNSILVYVNAAGAIDTKAFLKWIIKDNNYALFNLSAGEEYYQLFKAIPHVIFPRVVAGHSQETKIRLGQKVIKNLKNYFSRID